MSINIEKTKAIGKGLAKGLVSTIPYVGDTAIAVYDEIASLQATRKIQRLEEMYTALSTEIATMKDSINNNYINKLDFLDIFEKASHYIVNERCDEKRGMFRNILINSIISPNCTYDKTEKYMRILEKLDFIELKILAILNNPIQYNNTVGNPIKDPNRREAGVISYSTSWGPYKAMDILKRLLAEKVDDVEDAIPQLEQERLIYNRFHEFQLKTNGHPIETINDKLTEKGKDFVAFILR